MVCNGIHRDHAETNGLHSVQVDSPCFSTSEANWPTSLVTIHNRHKHQSVFSRVTLVTIGSQRALRGRRSGKKQEYNNTFEKQHGRPSESVNSLCTSSLPLSSQTRQYNRHTQLSLTNTPTHGWDPAFSVTVRPPSPPLA